MFQFHQKWMVHFMVQTIPKWGLHGTGCTDFLRQVSCAMFRPQRSMPKSRSEPRPLLGIDKTWCQTWGYPQTVHEKYHKKVMKIWGIPRKFFVYVWRMELGNLM
jgi:hypothetical protein